MPPGGDWSTCIQLTPVVDEQEVTPRYLCGRPVERSTPVARLEAWRRSLPAITTDARRGSRALLDRSTEDLAALRLFDPEHPDRTVVAAGAPWFMTLFGRDSLLTSWMAMIVDSDLALGTLQTLARFQGERREPDHRGGAGPHPARDALRRVGGALARRRADLLRQRRRDAAVRHAARRAASAGATGARRSTRCSRPPTARCSGSTSSATATATATSSTSARATAASRTRAGRTPTTPRGSPTARSRSPPDRALRGAGRTCTRALDRRARGSRTEARRRRLRRRAQARAADLKLRFNRDFWVEERRLASPWASTATSSRSTRSTSNMGHCLWTAHRRRGQGARSSRSGCVSKEMFSGWGIRTLASSMTGLQPDQLPQRQRVAARQRDLRRGLMRYGFIEEAHRVMEGIVDAAALVRQPASRSCSRASRATSSRSR